LPLAHPICIADNRVPYRIRCTSRPYLAPSRFSLEHPRPHAPRESSLYQVLQQENPATIEKVKAVLEKHPWYAHQWQGKLQDVPVADHNIMLFMQATRWPDDVRMRNNQYHRGPWHYINWPFKPEGQPASVQAREPESVNILTALAENEHMVRKETDPERKAIALAWLFHLVGDIRQPLHTAQLLSVEYPQGREGWE
jgi:S1/P1 Nuclease